MHTGNPKYVAITNHVLAASSDENMPSIKNASSFSKHDTSAMPLRMVSVTLAPISTAPETSKIEARMTACLVVTDPAPTLVPHYACLTSVSTCR